jgi:two-component system chemotaxis response regulator CheY
VENGLLVLELGGAEIDEELVSRIVRALRSVQGGRGFFELAKVRELANQAERDMAPIRSHKAVPTPDRIGVLLGATDQQLAQPGRSQRPAIRPISPRIWPRSPGCAMTSRPPPWSTGVPPPSRRTGRAAICGRSWWRTTSPAGWCCKTFLSRYGACHVAVNGREAVEAFRAALEHGQPYDLICMDIMMPEMGGREAVRQVRALEEARGVNSTHGAKIIMTTAVDDLQEVIRCFQELCDSYLVKPLDLARLLGQMEVSSPDPVAWGHRASPNQGEGSFVERASGPQRRLSGRRRRRRRMESRASPKSMHHEPHHGCKMSPLYGRKRYPTPWTVRKCRGTLGSGSSFCRSFTTCASTVRVLGKNS